MEVSMWYVLYIWLDRTFLLDFEWQLLCPSRFCAVGNSHVIIKYFQKISNGVKNQPAAFGVSMISGKYWNDFYSNRIWVVSRISYMAYCNDRLSGRWNDIINSSYASAFIRRIRNLQGDEATSRQGTTNKRTSIVAIESLKRLIFFYLHEIGEIFEIFSIGLLTLYRRRHRQPLLSPFSPISCR